MSTGRARASVCRTVPNVSRPLGVVCMHTNIDRYRSNLRRAPIDTETDQRGGARSNARSTNVVSWRIQPLVNMTSSSRDNDENDDDLCSSCWQQWRLLPTDKCTRPGHPPSNNKLSRASRSRRVPSGQSSKALLQNQSVRMCSSWVADRCATDASVRPPTTHSEPSPSTPSPAYADRRRLKSSEARWERLFSIIYRNTQLLSRGFTKWLHTNGKSTVQKCTIHRTEHVTLHSSTPINATTANHKTTRALTRNSLQEATVAITWQSLQIPGVSKECKT